MNCPLKLVLLTLGILLLSACGALGRREAVPEQDARGAQVPGIPNARFWPMDSDEALVAEAADSIAREQRAREQGSDLPPAVFLAISGGGDKGAFGAGLLNGWSARGGRPQFKMVTGVSTGALIAPFAFLGSDFKAKHREEFDAVYMQALFKYGLDMATAGYPWNKYPPGYKSQE